MAIASLVTSIAVQAAEQAAEQAAQLEWHWKGNRVPVYSDNRTGFAIRGFDPVAYFADGAPKRGLPQHEVYWQGAYWIFANPGNRDAFAKNPEIYAPQFGGYAVVSLSHGALAESEPELFVVDQGRLYLFAGTRQQFAFNREPDYFLERAGREWALRRGIDPQEEAEAIAASGSGNDTDSGVEPQAINPEHEKPFIPKL
ncbi:MAG: YHS domain-containing (seleno)protein [Pseudomonadota bacterium]